MMLFYTILSVPYSALSGVITSKSQDRTELISFRFIAAFSGTTLVNYFTLDLVKILGGSNEALGWQLTMGVYGIAAAVLFAIVFFTTEERIKPSTEQKTKALDDIKDLLNNRPWLVLFSLALIIMITITMRAGASIYYIKYYVNRPDLIKYFLTAYGLALAAGAAAAPIMTKFLDMKEFCPNGNYRSALYFVLLYTGGWYLGNVCYSYLDWFCIRAKVTIGIFNVCRRR